MTSYLKPFFAALTICCALSPVAAQNTHSRKPLIIGEKSGTDGTNCEDTMAVFDLIAETAGDEKTIIIIARRGRGESSRIVAGRRLRNVQGHLSMVRGVAEERIITAEGERVRGLGKVEVYIGGTLHTVFYMKRNGDFRRGCGV